ASPHSHGQLRDSWEEWLRPVTKRLEAQLHREPSKRPAVVRGRHAERFQRDRRTRRSLEFLREPRRLQFRLEFHSLVLRLPSSGGNCLTSSIAPTSPIRTAQRTARA